MIFVHAYTMYVYVFLFVSAGLERYDTTLDEAAAGLGASRALALRRVTLPLLTPSLAGAMLLVFMSALGSFSAPYIFGGGARVLATQILVSKLNGALGLAYVETTVLAVTAVIALLVLRRLQGSRRYSVAGKGRATRAALRSPVTRALLPPLAIALVVLLVLPHAMVDPRELRARRRVDDAGAAAGVHARQLPAARARRARCGDRSRTASACRSWRPRPTRSSASRSRTSSC